MQLEGKLWSSENGEVPAENQDNLIYSSSDGWTVERIRSLTSPVRGLSTFSDAPYPRPLSDTSKGKDPVLLFPLSHTGEGTTVPSLSRGGKEEALPGNAQIAEDDILVHHEMHHQAWSDAPVLFRIICLVTIFLGIVLVEIGSSGRGIHVSDLVLSSFEHHESSLHSVPQDNSHDSFSATKLDNEYRVHTDHDKRYSNSLLGAAPVPQHRPTPRSVVGANPPHLRVEKKNTLGLVSVDALQAIAGMVQRATSRLHYGLVVVGVLSVLLGVIVWISWWRRLEYMFFFCALLYGLVLLASCILLYLSWIENSELSVSSVEVIERVWNETLNSNVENLCFVEQYFLCSGFRSSCSILDEEPSTKSFSSKSSIPSQIFSRLSDSPPDSNALCNGSCLAANSSYYSTGKLEKRMLGFFLTPEAEESGGPFSTPCLERFHSFVGMTRTITILACLSTITCVSYGLYLFTAVKRVLAL